MDGEYKHVYYVSDHGEGVKQEQEVYGLGLYDTIDEARTASIDYALSRGVAEEELEWRARSGHTALTYILDGVPTMCLGVYGVKGKHAPHSKVWIGIYEMELRN